MSRLLLIEDESDLVRTVTDMLQAVGFDVESVQDGAAGVRVASERVFDVIVLDVMLPGLGGFEVCRTLRHLNVHTPILMLTARGELRDKVNGLRVGADDYVTKPFQP